MKFIFFSHPSFLNSKSMPRYTAMLAKGMEERGHSVEILSPKAHFFKLPFSKKLKKWFGYIDQYLLFPFLIKAKIKRSRNDTLFVFTDHALGPWVPLAAGAPHIIHCHDFLAQQSAMGSIAENKTSWTGKQYQAYIKRGFSKGKNFVSVSQKTKRDLHNSLGYKPEISEVIYNALNPVYTPFNDHHAKRLLQKKVGVDLMNGYLLHVGGNQWYKNRTGVIQIYNAWRSISAMKQPLLLIGEMPGFDLVQLKNNSPFQSDIHFLCDISDADVHLAYAGASVFLFPSLAEGFGWPIAEAMASGCVVVTTGEVPMTEIAGTAAFFIKKTPATLSEQSGWAFESGTLIEKVLNLNSEQRQKYVEAGLVNVERFNSTNVLDSIENLYKKILQASFK